MLRKLFYALIITSLGALLAACVPGGMMSTGQPTPMAVTPTATPIAVEQTVEPSPTEQLTAGEDYEPVAAEICEDMRTAVAGALGVDATTETAPFTDYIANLSGNGCQVTVTGTGEDFESFIDVARTIQDVLAQMGWTEDTAYLADGPTGTAFAMRLDPMLALVSVDWRPAEGVECPEDQPISACEIMPEEQLYTITVNLAQRAQGQAVDPAEQAGMIVRQAVMQQLGVSFDEIEVVEVEAVEWPDACLGLPATDEMCAQAITPGYRVVIEARGERYVFRTDAHAMNVRLEEAPEAQIGDTVVEWTGAATDLGSVCQAARIGDQGVAFGLCGGVLMSDQLAGPERAQELAHFAETYAPFEAQTLAGQVVFHGQGAREAAASEQRMIAEWARLAFIEATGGRSGASYGLALAWHREGGVAGFCDDLTVYVTGKAYATSCGGGQAQDLGQLWLDAGQLAQLYTWIDMLQNFELEQKDPAVTDAMTVRLIFSGAGEQQATAEEQQSIMDFAAQIYAAAGAQ